MTVVVAGEGGSVVKELRSEDRQTFGRWQIHWLLRVLRSVSNPEIAAERHGKGRLLSVGTCMSLSRLILQN